MRKEAGELAALETRYWHGFNDLQLHMRAHAEERDVLLRRVRACVPMRQIVLMQLRLALIARQCGCRQCCNAQCAMPHLSARELCGCVGMLVRLCIEWWIWTYWQGDSW